jgi:WD40 repeat protein
VLWETYTGTKVRSFLGHRQVVSAVSFSPDGKHVLTGSHDKTAVLWETATGTKVRSFPGPMSFVYAVAISPDGKHVLTGSDDNTAVLWETATGTRLRSFQGHTNYVIAVAFRPDGKHVLTGSGDGTTRLWDSRTGKELAQLLSLDQGQDWLVVTPEGLFDGSPGGRAKVTFRVDGGLRVVRQEQMLHQRHRPGLLAELLGGQRPIPAAD